MVLIAENLHIISKTTKEAIARRDDDFILNIVKKVKETGFNTFDLNIGPAKGPIEGAMEYLTKLILKEGEVNFSFDSSKFEEINQGFKALNNSKIAENSFLNSVSYDEAKLNAGFEIVNEFNSNLIALAFDPKVGIAKTSGERMDYCCEILSKAAEAGIPADKIYFDPLVLPLSAAQNQANIVIETIRMLTEGIEDANTIVGLSNISNGSPKELRPLINRVFLVLCMGAGLKNAIVDGLDGETLRIYNVVSEQKPLNNLDKVYCSLYNVIREFEDVDDIDYDKNDSNQVAVIRTARVLCDKEIYFHSFCQGLGA